MPHDGVLKVKIKNREKRSERKADENKIILWFSVNEWNERQENENAKYKMLKGAFNTKI